MFPHSRVQTPGRDAAGRRLRRAGCREWRRVPVLGERNRRSEELPLTTLLSSDSTSADGPPSRCRNSETTRHASVISARG